MDLPRKENLVLDHRYFNGDFRDYSGNNNHGVPTGCYFQKKPDKHVIFEGTDLITVADSAELQLTEFTVIPYGDFNAYTNNDEFVSKRDAGGTNYEIFANSATVISLNDGSNTRSATLNWTGGKSLAVSCVSGSTAKGYVDGAFVSDFNDTSTITADDADLLIGNIYTGTRPQTNPLKGVLIYNVALTDEEIAQVHEWIMAQKTPSYPKRNFVYPSQITGDENGLTGGYDMKNIHQEIVDKTDGGVRGTIVDATQCKLNNLDALCFNGSTSYVDLGDNYDIGTGDFTISCLVKLNLTGAIQNIISKGAQTSTAEGYFFRLNASNQLNAGVSDGSSYVLNSQLSSGSLVTGEWHHVMWELDRDGNSTFYINGNADATTADISGWAATDIDGATSAFIGKLSTVQFLGGEVAEFRFYNKVLSANEKAELYNKYAKMPYFLDDLKDANESIAVEGGAIGEFLSNTAWRFGDTSARYKIGRDSVEGLTGGSQLLADNNMEEVGVGSWGSVNSASLSKETVNPKEGTQVLRVTRNGVNNPGASQVIFTIGKKYRVTGWARSDGNSAPRVRSGTTNHWVGTTSTNWQYIDTTFVSTSTSLVLNVSAAGTEYSEFDALNIYEVDTNDKVIECTTSGLLYQEMKQAYGTYEFDMYKAPSGLTSIAVGYITNDISDLDGANQSGYWFQFSSSERFVHVESTGGAHSNRAFTGLDYADNDVWYKIRVTRRYDGQFTLYVKGGVFTDWTLIDVSGGAGTNPDTDNTVTSSKYCVLDMGVGDKIANFKYYNGVLTP